MNALLSGIQDEMSKTLERWLVKEIKPYIPDKFDTAEKIKKNAEEVALYLEKRGIKVTYQIPKNIDFSNGNVVRQWVLIDEHNNELISELKINLKTHNEVL